MTNSPFVNWAEIGRLTGPCIRPGGPVLTERALNICNLPPGSLVADIGCGPGGTLEYLEQKGLYGSVGLDCSQDMLSEALPALVTGRIVCGRAEALPFKEDRFHALFCECLLSLLSHRAGALGEFARVLKDEGFLVISDLFLRGGTERLQLEGRSEIDAPGLPTKEGLLHVMTRLGFSLLLWEEQEQLLKEFAVRMIFAGKDLSDLWACGQGQEWKKTDHTGISYFLLVARKQAGAFPIDQEQRRR
jgi:arsenite methyltransferase